ncbi:MAG: EAL domain-containing response regulator [Gemmatimonadetes bacterium]|nr:EAL domain-containing response regulator [Gemmatimonadota bacterium]
MQISEFASTRVLIVDDQEHVRRWVRSVLKGAGITDVTEATDGKGAFDIVTRKDERFDLILCDLRMPGRDGIETIRSLSPLHLDTAIAIMSIEEERVIETAGILAEVQGLHLLGTVSKPLTAAKLTPLLERMREHETQRRSPAAAATVIEPALEHELRSAFELGELTMAYQPKIRMLTGEFAGVEALVRWNHPQRGLLSPAFFVPALEASDEFSPWLTDFVLEHAISTAGRWRQSGRELPVAINLSVRAFDQLDLPERVELYARDAGVPAEWITLEITETQVERDEIRLLDVATRLRLKGFNLSIDDFGTGQSGLSKLHRLPFNELKIDRQFVHGASHSSTQRSVVEASLALARSLRMTAVAEGIQQRPDWDLLVGLGCEVMQGFFVARPMSEEGLTAWTAHWKSTAGERLQ